MATTKANELGQFGSKLTVHNENITLDGTVHGQYAGFDSDINASSIGDLSNVDITTSAPSNNQSLIWDNANSKFVPGDSFSQSDFNTAFGNKSTSDLSEGTNEYHTTARARGSISATGSLSYNSSTGVMSFTQGNTDTISEGSSNLYYTDARADARVALVVDAAPSTLNTLNELAAALGDDANFSTTVTTSIATKLPLAGGAITGNVTFGDNNKAIFGAGPDLEIYSDGTHSYIEEKNASGNFYIKAESFNVGRQANSELYMTAQPNGAVTLYYDNASKLTTTSTGIDVTGVITTDGMTTSADINFGDDDKALFGASNDLKIYHSANNQSYIHEVGSGDLNILATNLKLQDAGGSTKVLVNSTGIDVTGTVTATGVGGFNDYIDLNTSGNRGKIGYDSNNVYIGSTSSTGAIYFKNNINSTGAPQSSGDTKMVITDSGVGIGTDSPDAKLDIEGNFESSYALKFTNTMGTGVVSGFRSHGTNGESLSLYHDGDRRQMWNSNGSVTFENGDGNDQMHISATGNVGIGTSSPVSSSGYSTLSLNGASGGQIAFKTGDVGKQYIFSTSTDLSIFNSVAGNLKFVTNNAERMRIDSSGNLVVGKTAIGIANVGGELRADGQITGTKDGGAPLALNRKTSDGDIALFQQDGATVGSIGVAANDNLYIAGGTGSTKGLYLNDSGVVPANTGGAPQDNASDLGASSVRFKDLHLSGNVNVGGTVDGRDVATDGTKLDGIETGATADQTKADIEGLGIDVPATNLTGTIAAARLSTATTQAESDDSTKIATTAYVTDKITTLIGGAPSTLNDLNELAAAINDDANYNSTLTTALGTKLPKSGGTMTGNLVVQKSTPTLRLHYAGVASGNYPTIRFTTNNNQGVKIEHNEFDGELPVAGYGLIVKNDNDNTQTNTTSFSVLGEMFTGSSTVSGLNKVFHDAYHPNADTLTTARTINGVSFNGSANITVADSTKLPLSGGTMTGNLRATTLDFGDASPTLSDNGDYLRIQTATGYTDIGSSSGSYSHFMTDRSNFYFNKKLVVDTGIVRSYNEDLHLDRAGSTTARLRLLDGTTYSDQAFQVPGVLRITETGTAQHIMIGNQDSGGANKPAMITGVNGALKLGYGDSWSGEGGSVTTKLEVSSTGVYVTGNITVSGTVDGRDVATDGTKLDGIEAGATADQTKADIDALNINANTLDGRQGYQYVFDGLNNGATDIIVNDADFIVRDTTDSITNFLWRDHSVGKLYLGTADAQPTTRYDLYTQGGSKYFHAGNDGAGSGLDADTVDGIQGSSFLRSDADDMTSGKLTIDSTGQLYVRYNNSDVYRAGLDWNVLQLGNNGQNNVVAGHNNTGGHFRFYVNNTSDVAGGSATNGINAMTIDAAGDVGIGVDPYSNSKLTIGGTDASGYSSVLMFDNNASSGAEFFMLASDTAWTAGANKFIMGHGAPSSSNVDMTITSNGSVGMGTYNPTERLHVSGNILLTGNLVGSSTTTEIGQFGSNSVGAIKRIRMTQGGELHFGDTSTSNFFGITEGTVNQFSDTDRLGIYYRNELKLYSNTNTLRVTFDVSGNVTATGNITANSDISLKDNITPIPNALDKVLQIRGVTFNRNDIEDNPRHAGVIAQEVEKVLPEVVSEGEDGIKSVAYGNMVGLLIEAIKEQQKQIDMLKEKLESK